MSTKMNYQRAKFINRELSVFQREVWVRNDPHYFMCRYAQRIDGSIDTSEQRTHGLGFPTNVIHETNGLPMIALLKDIELQPLFVPDIPFISFTSWIKQELPNAH